MGELNAFANQDGQAVSATSLNDRVTLLHAKTAVCARSPGFIRRCANVVWGGVENFAKR